MILVEISRFRSCGIHSDSGGRHGVITLAVRLPRSIEKRPEKLARRTGRTKTYYVREAILQHLEDLEDLYLAERVLDRIQRGEEHTTPLTAVMKVRRGARRKRDQ